MANRYGAAPEVTAVKTVDRRWPRLLSWSWLAPISFAICLGLAWLPGADVAVFSWINGFSRVTGEGLWANLTILGDGLVLMVLIIPFAIYNPRWAWAMLVAGGLTGLAVRAGKALLVVDRPLNVLPPESFILIGDDLTSRAFPSGHAAGALTMAAVLVVSVRSQALRAALLLGFLLVAISRVVVGAHWPSDVMAGALLGWLCGLGGLRIIENWQWVGSRPAQLAVMTVLSGCAVALLFHESGYPSANTLQYVIAVSLLLLAVIGWFRASRGAGVAKRGVATSQSGS